MKPLRLASLIVGTGIAFDIAANGQTPGASVPLFVLLIAVAMWLTMPRTAYRTFTLAAATTVAALVPFRASVPLVSLDCAIAAGLLGVAATGGDLLSESIVRAVDRLHRLARSVFGVPRMLLEPISSALPRVGSGRTRTILRAAAIAIPVILLFALLLGSADPVFARTVLPRLPHLRFQGVASHVSLAILGMVLAGTLWVASRSPLPDRDHRDRGRLSAGEWLPVLIGIAVLFAIFVVVQAAVLFAGKHHVEVTPGLTYAQYARSGFFQLLAAGALTFVVTLGAWDLGKRASERDRRLFAILVSCIAALTVVILVSAAIRLALYQQAFGFTVTRLAAWFAIGFAGAALLVLVATIWLNRRAALTAGIALLALAATVAGNIVNPDAFVAARNIERFHATGKIDASYLAGLGPDAAPALASASPSLNAGDAATIKDGICIGAGASVGVAGLRAGYVTGWRSWNDAFNRARAAAKALGCR